MAQQIPSVADGVLSEGETSILIDVDTQRWQQWLEGVQSFRYVPSKEAPYTARKEKSKKADGDYWYAYRKVQGKLHKRYIGRSSDLTLDRLEEVASLLSVPAEPRAKPEVTEQVSVTQSDEVTRLQNEVERLQNDNQQLQNELQKRLSELKQLQNELQNKQKDLEVAAKKVKSPVDKAETTGLDNEEFERLQKKAIGLEQNLKIRTGELEALSNTYNEMLESRQEILSQNLLLEEKLKALESTPRALPDQGEIRDKRSLLAARDRVLATLKLGKQAPKYKASKALLDQFIAELPASTPTSTPDNERVMEWVNYALEDLKLGDTDNAMWSLKQALAVHKEGS
jgi:HAMP domain-containing protein